jgi:hypothetical protein
MKGVDTAAAAPGAAPPPQQVRAKDAAYLLIAHASPESRQKLVEAVVGWYAVDFNGRNLAGDYSAEQVIRSLGSAAAAKLVDALDAEMPSQALVKIAELIGQLGDDATKTSAGDRLVAIETEMEADAFVTRLSARIQGQMQVANPGATLDTARITTAAQLNRENFINDGALPAMKHLNRQSSVVERLLAISESGSNLVRRQRALMALEGSTSIGSHLQRFLGLALNAENPPAVRDYAFDRVGDIGSTDAIEPLWPLVQDATDENQRLRWRAGELILHLGGPGIVPDFLSKLPVTAGVKFEPEELEGYATRMSQMTPAPSGLRRYLVHNNWYVRVVALRFFERKGTDADIPAMRNLVRDTTDVVGTRWPDEMKTVAKVAEAAIAALRERLSQPQQNSPQAQPEQAEGGAQG